MTGMLVISGMHHLPHQREPADSFSRLPSPFCHFRARFANIIRAASVPVVLLRRLLERRLYILISNSTCNLTYCEASKLKHDIFSRLTTGWLPTPNLVLFKVFFFFSFFFLLEESLSSPLWLGDCPQGEIVRFL